MLGITPLFLLTLHWPHTSSMSRRGVLCTILSWWLLAQI